MKKFFFLIFFLLLVVNSAEAQLSVTGTRSCTGNNVPSCTTSPSLSTSTGSLFACNAGYFGTFSAISDANGNSYSTAVAEVADTGNGKLRQGYKENATGGASTTWTLTLTANNYPTMNCIAVTGAKTS